MKKTHIYMINIYIYIIWVYESKYITKNQPYGIPWIISPMDFIPWSLGIDCQGTSTSRGGCTEKITGKASSASRRTSSVVASVVGFAAGDLLWMDYGLWIMLDYDCGYYVIICSNYNGYYGLTIVISITVMVDYDYMDFIWWILYDG